MSMWQWIIILTDNSEPLMHHATTAFIVPGGYLALGEGDIEQPELFRPSLIVAPGYWARAYQMPIPTQEVQGQ